MNLKAFSLSLTLLSLVQPVQAQILQDGNLCKIITFIPFTDCKFFPTCLTVAGLVSYVSIPQKGGIQL